MAGTATGVVKSAIAICDSAIHPIRTVKQTWSGIKTIYKDPEIIVDAAESYYSRFVKEDGAGKAYILGNATGGLVADYLTGKLILKIVNNASDVSKGINAVEEIIDQSTDVSRGVNVVDDVVEGTGELAYKTGKQGEKYLAELVGGESQKYFKTSLGGRYVDQFADGIACEAKVGYRSLDSFTKKQILKDIELMNKGLVDGVEWHFFRSGNTGKIGPSAPLLKMLEESGIDVIIHK